MAKFSEATPYGVAVDAKMISPIFALLITTDQQKDHVMTNYKLAYIEHISQLLNYKIKKVHVLTGNTLLELESIQSYLKELSRVYEEYRTEEGLDFDS